MKSKSLNMPIAGIVMLIVSILFWTFAPVIVYAKTSIKLAHVCTENDIFHIQSLKFKELVEQRTNSEIEIKIFPNKQLGGKETDLIGMVQMGVIGLATITCGPITTYDPLFGILDMPFLFASKDQAYKVLDGPIGERFLNSLSKVDIKGLAFGERGLRNVSNNLRPITQPSDLKGIKIRVMESPVYIELFKALGANPVPMGWGDVYTALQQGIIDAQENPPWVIEAFKIYEVQKFYSITGHSYAANVIMMNEKLLKGFSSEIQQIFIDSAKEASVYERKVNNDGVSQILERLKGKGMKINEVDSAPFQKLTESVYEDAYKKNPEWKEIIFEIRAVK
ncbi:MAG: DctP family TRAP transporter solute-binding subunit [Proteobacteria bacterium]|nr:DctP family TRAP transporter solute-binding subunit [Pseudomonadota bacterium]MBU1696669.1 DctP family TRAP transporter solute-binding subunit [Pseudomonadota bacterium]